MNHRGLRIRITETFGPRMHSAYLFGRYYPQRAAQMRIAAAVGRTPSADLAILAMLIDDLGPWLAAEYIAVHGVKAPRS